jgi:stage IV sporulation protein FB
MLFAEPAPSQGDLHFRLFGFPVRIHPFFWLVTVLFGAAGDTRPWELLVWIAVVLVSILVHELGHAVLQRQFGGRPRIVIHGMGGLAICDDCDPSPMRQILISLAGPAAGFLLALVIVLGVWTSGRNLILSLFGLVWQFGPNGVRWAISDRFTTFAAILSEPFGSMVANRLIHDLLLVNVLWGLVNLLPIYPLDGGRVARELLTLRNPRQGIIYSLQLSIGVAAGMALYAITQQSLFTCVLFGMLAYSSYQALETYRNHWR